MKTGSSFNRLVKRILNIMNSPESMVLFTTLRHSNPERFDKAMKIALKRKQKGVTNAE